MAVNNVLLRADLGVIGDNPSCKHRPVLRCGSTGPPMPTVLRVEDFRFYFFSLDRGEPPHIHVAHGDKLAKYWLSPVELASSERSRAHELNQVRALVIEHRNTFQEAWDEHFRSQGRQD